MMHNLQQYATQYCDWAKCPRAGTGTACCYLGPNAPQSCKFCSMHFPWFREMRKNAGLGGKGNLQGKKGGKGPSGPSMKGIAKGLTNSGFKGNVPTRPGTAAYVSQVPPNKAPHTGLQGAQSAPRDFESKSLERLCKVLTAFSTSMRENAA